MKNLSLRVTIALSFIILLLVVSIIVIGLTYRSGQRDVRNLAASLHSQSFARVRETINAFMMAPQDFNREILSDFRSGLLHLDDPKAIGRHLFNQIQNTSHIISSEYADEQRNDIGPARNLFGVKLSYGITGADTGYVYRLYESDTKMSLGKVLYEETNYDPRQKPWYQYAATKSLASWTPIYLWPTGDVGLDAVLPIRSDGRLLGVLDTAITVNEISQFIKEIKITPNTKIHIVEASGLVVAGSDIDEPFIRKNGSVDRLQATESASPELNRAFRHLLEVKMFPGSITQEHQFTIQDGATWFITIAPYTDQYGLDWLILVHTPEADIMTNLYANARSTTSFVFLAIILSIALAYIISYRITSPLSKLTKYSEALSRGDWSQQISIYRTDEVGHLADAFRHMVRQLQIQTQSLAEYAKEMLTQRQKLETVLSSMGDAVCVADIHRDVILVNNAFLKITGYPAQIFVNRKISTLVNKLTSPGTNREKINDFLDLIYNESTGVMYLDTTEIIRKSKLSVSIDSVGSRLRDKEGKTAGIVWVIRDVTKQHELEKMKNVFVSLASHQLRTPLTGIKWSIGSLKKSKETVPPHIASIIKDIDKSNNKMISLVDALLNVSRVESADVKEVRRSQIAIRSILDTAKTEVQRIYKEKDIKLMGIDKIDTTHDVFGDGQQLVQVFVNLLQNAAIYSHSGKSVTVSVKKVDQTIVVSIADKGYGIPENQQDRIFERFFRASNVSNTIPGTGLGLYYVKKVVDLHGGTVWFKSKLHKGTTFYISLLTTKKSVK